MLIVMRKLTTNQLRALADVHKGRIKRTATGWLSGSSSPDSTLRRALSALLDRGLITADHGYALEPGETTTAELTRDGADRLRHETGDPA